MSRVRRRARTLVGLLAVLPAVLAAACAKPYLPVRAELPAQPAVPPDVVAAHTTFTGKHGTQLYARSWRPEGEVRGVLVIMHGLRDHGDHYAPFAVRLVRRGYAVYAYDLRGHGRSAGRRVTVDSWSDYVDDLATYIGLVRAAEPGRPLFVFGHSMGGAIVGLWGQRAEADAAGLIFSAPALWIDKPPVAAAAILLSSATTPNVGALAPDNRGFSSDPEVTREMGKDALIFQPPGPVATAAGLIGAMERFWAGVHRLTLPLLMLHGTGDVLTAPAGSRAIYLRAGATDKTLRLYDGLFHDLVHEPRGGGERVQDDIMAWLDAHTGGPATSFPAPDLGRRLAGDKVRPAVAVTMQGRYLRSDGDDPVQGGSYDVRTRTVLGGARAGWGIGLDSSLGSLDGLSYRVTAQPIGVGLVSCAGHVVTLGVGGGFSDPGGGVGFGWEVPVALDVGLQLGPVRVLAWGHAAWVFSEDARQDGSRTLSFVDEAEAGLALRLGRNHRYWASANAGTGPSLGVTVSELLGARVYGVVLGLDLWGGN